MEGLVLASSSEGFLRFSGLRMKKRVDAAILITTITRKFSIESLTSRLSRMPRPNPKPSIGPMTGDMSIAPMMTGMELTFNPTDAMMIAQARMNTLCPLNAMFFLIDRLATEWSTSSDRLTWSFRYSENFPIKNKRMTLSFPISAYNFQISEKTDRFPTFQAASIASR